MFHFWLLSVLMKIEIIQNLKFNGPLKVELKSYFIQLKENLNQLKEYFS